MTAMVTPFGKDGNVDYELLKKLIDHLLSTGTDGILVSGTTGEGPTLTEEEKIAFMKEALKEANSAYEAGEVPIGCVIVSGGRIIGRGHNRREELQDAGTCGTLMNLLGDERFNHLASVEKGCLGNECGKLLSDFFASLRIR